ncbi:unnamed protein product [Acanthoscelides obtectus]|uniref:Uncharacterized protein n=1 Tax=Acanthoscelides obtectus TaxID=200917 RepID=A0A9P0LIM1_ACAOB|nr:unnamed protein product [Acanthoscelides obtectus]CAK1653157.1 hypothetical protein AOBTE_LOCUS18094 [Acanthoscelides obtectus]
MMISDLRLSVLSITILYMRTGSVEGEVSASF